jgi:hypothetical protein
MILNRSPYYYNVPFPNAFVEAVDFTVEVGAGSLTTPVIVNSYSLTKPKQSTTSTNVYIDVSPIVHDNYSFTPIDFTGIGTTNIIQSTLGTVLITRVTAEIIDTIGNNEEPLSNKYISTDGYGGYLDGQNLDPANKILLSHDQYRADYRGYFIVPLRVSSGDDNPTVNTVEVDLNFTDNVQNYVKYLIIPLNLYSGNIYVEFMGDNITIEIINECKYDINPIQFVNRFGVLELMHFYKTKKDSLSVKRDNFKNAYTDGVSYDVKQHQIQSYNVKSNKTTKIETGFLPEEYNQTMQELLQSEYVWIGLIPINVNQSSLEFKKRSIDKLISYGIDFSYAFDEISNV